MKHLLIIFSLLLTSVSWSENINYNDLVKRDGLYYKKFSDKPFTGNATGKTQGKIKDGKKEGEWLAYYDSGKLAHKNYYKNGKSHFKSFWYDVDGRLSRTYIYYKEGGIKDIIYH